MRYTATCLLTTVALALVLGGSAQATGQRLHKPFLAAASFNQHPGFVAVHQCHSFQVHAPPRAVSPGQVCSNW